MSEHLPKPLPAHITARSDGITDPMELYSGAVRHLGEAYWCMLTNGTPDYALIAPGIRHWFERWTKEGYLYSLVMFLQDSAIAEAMLYGFHVDDVALSVFCMNRVAIGQPLPLSATDRNELELAAIHLQTLERRIDAAETLAELRAAPTSPPAILAALTAPAAPSHAPDFAWVRCPLGDFTFTPKQRQVVAELWRDWKSRGLGVTLDRLRTVGILGNRDDMRGVFKNHPAWNVLIVTTDLKDMFRLALAAPRQENLELPPNTRQIPA